MHYYQIQGHVSIETPGFTSNRDIPTFYLAKNVSGILNTRAAAEIGARKIEDLLFPFASHIHITAMDMETCEIETLSLDLKPA